LEPAAALLGRLAYSRPPSTKNTTYVDLRPILSERLAQKKRPPMLNRLSSAAKPAAMPAMALSWPGSSSPNFLSRPSRWPPKISWSIGLARPITPMPADTFIVSTSQTSQNCGMPQIFFTCTWPRVIIASVAVAGGVQPAGFQPETGTR
jgi:hypothetical protein